MSAGQRSPGELVLAEAFSVQAGSVAASLARGFNVGKSSKGYGGSAFPEPSH